MFSILLKKKKKIFLSAIDAKMLQLMQFIWTLFQGKRPNKEEMVPINPALVNHPSLLRIEMPSFHPCKE
jgi:hypothetical protein